MGEMVGPEGPCGFCGFPDRRHRFVDTQMGRVAAGDHIDQVAFDFDMTVRAMVHMWESAYGFAIELQQKGETEWNARR